MYSECNCFLPLKKSYYWQGKYSIKMICGKSSLFIFFEDESRVEFKTREVSQRCLRLDIRSQEMGHGTLCKVHTDRCKQIALLRFPIRFARYDRILPARAHVYCMVFWAVVTNIYLCNTLRGESISSWLTSTQMTRKEERIDWIEATIPFVCIA